MNQKTRLTAITVFFATSSALAQTAAVEQSFTQSPAYKECTALATSNPMMAEAKANEWLKFDDGIGAHHCRAMALYGQRRFAEAAQELDAVHGKISPQNITLRSYVARQGSKAWIEAGRPDAAIANIGMQINDLANAPNDNATQAKLTSDLLLQRARLNATYGKYSEAVQDLDHAVSLNPTNEDVLLERANAFEQLHDIPLAKNDVAVVLRLNPGNAKALAVKKRLDTAVQQPKAL
jgi:tetratricopeptide (TPR) repeat protein